MSNVSFTISNFLELSKQEFIGQLTTHYATEHNKQPSTQITAWEKEFDDLHNILQEKKGRIIFEYSIPSLPKVIDVILLIEGKIFVLEYKVNANAFNTDAINQTNGYALRLKYFHSNSNDNCIIPILVATNGNNNPLTYEKSEEDSVYHTIQCNSTNLKNAIDHILSHEPYYGSDEWEEKWEYGFFKASSTIIDAARNVWRQNNVRDFTISEAPKETRLAAENYIVNTVVEETRKRNGKSICFVTGVPGAGKTLVGLNISVMLQAKKINASMLSGNGPLVKVLTRTLEKDLNEQEKKGKLIHPKDKISIETIVRDAYGYKKEIFEKRLEYTSGSGVVQLKKNADPGSQNVIIFDEAQRAWNKEKMIQPGQTGKKKWQEEAFPFSEPGLLLWDMNQREWGVIICLVGGGQEINTGEAGICEWLQAITINPDFKSWHVYMSDELLGEEYNSKIDNKKNVTEFKKDFATSNRLTINKSLHLATCQRSNRCDNVAEFIESLLSCKGPKASALYKEFKDKYHIYLTRDVNKAKNKLRERKEQLLNRGLIDGINNEDISIGMLMSSKAVRLRPLGFEIKKVSEYLSKVANWFLDPPDYVGASDFLEIALNEFFVQGLELDLTAVIWDADFRYNPRSNEWNYYKFNGHNWSPIEKKEQEVKRFYMKNAYRVLLTRARAGMVIVVPEGDPVDKTRKPEFYENTYNYLKSLGLKDLDE